MGNPVRKACDLAYETKNKSIRQIILLRCLTCNNDKNKANKASV
jgi:hypothetical protein